MAQVNDAPDPLPDTVPGAGGGRRAVGPGEGPGAPPAERGRARCCARRALAGLRRRPGGHATSTQVMPAVVPRPVPAPRRPRRRRPSRPPRPAADHRTRNIVLAVLGRPGRRSPGRAGRQPVRLGRDPAANPGRQPRGPAPTHATTTTSASTTSSPHGDHPRPRRLRRPAGRGRRGRATTPEPAGHRPGAGGGRRPVGHGEGPGAPPAERGRVRRRPRLGDGRDRRRPGGRCDVHPGHAAPSWLAVAPRRRADVHHHPDHAGTRTTAPGTSCWPCSPSCSSRPWSRSP